MANGIFLLYVFLTLVSGLSRGLRRQMWSLAVLAASAYLSGNAYIVLLPVTRSVIETEAGCRFASFAIVFVVITAVLSWTVDIVLDREYRRSDEMHMADRLGGALVGVIYAVGAVEVLAALVFTYPVLQWDRWLREVDIFTRIFAQWPFMLPLLPSEFQQVLELIR